MRTRTDSDCVVPAMSEPEIPATERSALCAIEPVHAYESFAAFRSGANEVPYGQ